MARKFYFNGLELPDPDPAMSIDEVRLMHAALMQELSNAETSTKKDGEDTVITFIKRVGQKAAKVKVEVEIPDGKFCNPEKGPCIFYWEDEDGYTGCSYLKKDSFIEGFQPEYYSKMDGCPNPEKK